jgi:hypothetical protein
VIEDDQRAVADGHGVNRYAVGINLAVLEDISTHMNSSQNGFAAKSGQCDRCAASLWK